MGSLQAACFELYAESHGKARWGDKRPAYAGYIGAVFRLFPQAQFINVVRDPRGAVSSLMRVGWHRREVALAASLATWEFSVGRVDAYSHRLRPDQLLDVRYEDLVGSPEATLERICAFAGLRTGDAIDQMLAGERTGTFRPGWHDRLSEPIDAANADAWRAHLSARPAALIEHVTANTMARFGYLPVTTGAVPDPYDMTRLDRERERRRRKWRRESRNELKRRLLYRHPVAAVPTPR